ncbi:MAG: HIT domain-containing protein [Anaerolineae bacterium]
MPSLPHIAADWLMRLARRRSAGPIVAWTVGHALPLLPVERLAETDHVVAFRHPRPSYATHILIVPRAAVADFLALDASSPILRDVVAVAQDLVRRLGLEGGYRLIVNGGANQDVAQLHWHLVSDA